MSVTELRLVLTPPRIPEEAGIKSGWKKVEEGLGTQLPGDYKEFVEVYGSGGIDSFMWILNPFSGNSNIELLSQVSTRLNALKVLEDEFRERHPFPLHPEKGGILPWAFTDNGDVLYWLTQDIPSNWSVVVNAGREAEWESFDLSFSVFLRQVLTRQIVVHVFPHDFPTEAPRFIPLSEFSG